MINDAVSPYKRRRPDRTVYMIVDVGGRTVVIVGPERVDVVKYAPSESKHTTEYVLDGTRSWVFVVQMSWNSFFVMAVWLERTV